MADHLEAEIVLLRHHRTEQTVMVTFGQYRQQATRRFRNWKLARGNVAPRPVLTVSECLMERPVGHQAGHPVGHQVGHPAGHRVKRG
jgi:hypothetical protein